MSHRDYSATPLSRKLGAKPGTGVTVFFTAERAELEQRFAALRDTTATDEGLWIAYPKQASPLASDLSFAAVQEIGLANGLVDNKSCAIDDHWTAVRFVRRVEDRGPKRRS